MRRALIAGNWKMYGRQADLGAIQALGMAGEAAKALDILICPPAPLITPAAQAAEGSSILIGAQDCAEFAADGAKTGDVNAAMLADAGAAYVILGHSERRHGRGETSALVRQKVEAAVEAGLAPILCVGETSAERAGGKAVAAVEAQLAESLPEKAPKALVVAYEPVWAIGGDRTPTPAEIEEMHTAVRNVLAARLGASAAQATRILYGGSVNAKNALEILAIPGVDGALVGRASLNAAEFSAIILAHPAART